MIFKVCWYKYRNHVKNSALENITVKKIMYIKMLNVLKYLYYLKQI